MYAQQQGEYRAFVSYDHGIADHLPTLAVQNLLKVRVPFHIALDNGLLSRDEFPVLSSIEDSFQEFVETNGGVYVGRVTVAGARHLFAYCDVSQRELRDFLLALEAKSEHALQYLQAPDPAREGYFQELYPSPDDWQVVQDLKVIASLEKHGDALTVPRQIDHLACFQSAADVATFTAWARTAGYTVVVAQPPGDHRVEFFHVGLPDLDSINPHSIGIARKAREHNGEYDGWGCMVVAAA
jgi:hypothetical protein